MVTEGLYRDYANQDFFRLVRRRNGHWIEVHDTYSQRSTHAELTELITRGLIVRIED
jgi:hypothetical protein